MNRTEWIAGTDPQSMLRWLTNGAPACPECGSEGSRCRECGGVPRGRQPHVTDRRLRLFAVAVYRSLSNLIEWYPDSQYGWVVDASEALADDLPLPPYMGSTVDSSEELDRSALETMTYCGVSDPANGAFLVCETHELLKSPPALQAALLREVFGNPFGRKVRCERCRGVGYFRTTEIYSARTTRVDEPMCNHCGGTGEVPGGIAVPDRLWVECDWCCGMGQVSEGYQLPADCTACDGRGVVPGPVLLWRDGTVRRIAERIYQERRWEECGILADALEEAGLMDADMLGHLRGEGPHARGCWSLDLLLGKGA